MSNILVVDDSRMCRNIATDLLARRNHSVTVVESAEEALSVLSNHQFDVVLTDYIMPGGMNGAELIMAIKTDLPEQCCILMSHVIDDSTKSCGADARFEKWGSTLDDLPDLIETLTAKQA